MNHPTNDIQLPRGESNVRPIRKEVQIEAPAAPLDNSPTQPNINAMNEVTRHELAATVAASEARVATVVEGMRADAAELRAELREGNALMKAQGEKLQAQAIEASAAAGRFYSDAGRLLAEIKLAGEQNKTAVMGMGYKVAAWLFGTILAIGSLSLAVYKAVSAAIS